MKPCDHRLSIPISEKMHKRLQKAFPWGTQSEIIRRVLELLLAKVEKDGYNTISLLISGQYNPLEDYEKLQEDQKEIEK